MEAVRVQNSFPSRLETQRVSHSSLPSGIAQGCSASPHPLVRWTSVLTTSYRPGVRAETSKSCGSVLSVPRKLATAPKPKTVVLSFLMEAGL